MFFKGRFLFFLLFLGLLGLLFSGVGRQHAYQDAYWQGYNAGLAADGDTSAAPPPPGYYGRPYAGPTRGFFGGFFPLIFLLLGFVFIGKLFMGRRYWARHHGRHHGHGPWGHKRRGHGRWGRWSDAEGKEKSPEDIDDMPDEEVRQA